MELEKDINTWTDNVMRLWERQKINLEPGASSDVISNVELYLSITFPNLFKELYKKVNGYKEMDWNEHMFCVWPLYRIIEEYNYHRYPDFVGFCDFLINSHWIGVVKNKSGIFKRYDSYPPVKIAENFQEVIEMINNGSDMIY